MTVKQISVFLENKPGKLAAFTEVLRQNNINMRAMSIAEAPDFGIARIITTPYACSKKPDTSFPSLLCSPSASRTKPAAFSAS